MWLVAKWSIEKPDSMSLWLSTAEKATVMAEKNSSVEVFIHSFIH